MKRNTKHCPRCTYPIRFEEGWAYCQQCSALYCSDEEAAAIKLRTPAPCPLPTQNA